MNHHYCLNRLRLVPALLIFLALVPRATAASITPTGIIGNSGVEGKSLLRAGLAPLGPQGQPTPGVETRSPSGAWIDAGTGIWIGYRNRVENISLGGRLIESHPLSNDKARIDGNYFTAVDGTMYFFAHDVANAEGGDYALYALNMEPGELAKPVFQVPGIPSSKNAVLCPQPVDGKILFGSYGEKGIQIELFDPASQDSEVLFSFPEGENLEGLAYDKEKGLIIMGGFFGRMDPARINHAKVYELVCTDMEGETKWRCGEYFMEGIGANDYQGVLSLACGALWDSSWAGLFGRRNLEGELAPGKLSFENRISYSTQFLDLREALGQSVGQKGKDLLFVACHNYSAMYFGAWDRSASKFELLRRVGCLPAVLSINIGPDDRISLAGAQFPWSTWVLEFDQYWWNWEDGSDAPPDEANIHYGTTNGFYDKDGNLAVLNTNYPFTSASMKLLKPGGTIGLYGELPFKTPAGLTATVLGEGKDFAFATDTVSKSVWKCPLDKKSKPSGPWEKVEISGTELQDPGDIVTLQDGVLAIADKGQVLVIDFSGGKGELVKALNKWGDKPDQSFGERLCIAADGNMLVVSDSDRQRVLAFDSLDFGYVTSFGETDLPGDDLYHLNNPRKLAIRGDKIAISDQGNERVIKCKLDK